jgi:hypothetical protein
MRTTTIRGALAATSLVVLLATPLLATPSLAQEGHGHGHEAPSIQEQEGDPAVADPAVRAFIAAADRMHEAMSTMPYSGNADIDFARGMIPHHEAAIEMARIALEHGEDPAIRRLAEEVIEAQTREIGELEAWLAEHARSDGPQARGSMMPGSGPRARIAGRWPRDPRPGPHPGRSRAS